MCRTLGNVRVFGFLMCHVGPPFFVPLSDGPSNTYTVADPCIVRMFDRHVCCVYRSGSTFSDVPPNTYTARDPCIVRMFDRHVYCVYRSGSTCARIPLGIPTLLPFTARDPTFQTSLRTRIPLLIHVSCACSIDTCTAYTARDPRVNVYRSGSPHCYHLPLGIHPKYPDPK